MIDSTISEIKKLEGVTPISRVRFNTALDFLQQHRFYLRKSDCDSLNPLVHDRSSVQRIHFFRALFDLLDGIAATEALQNVKKELLHPDVVREWALRPILDHLKPRLTPEAKELLEGVVGGHQRPVDSDAPGNSARVESDS